MEWTRPAFYWKIARKRSRYGTASIARPDTTKLHEIEYYLANERKYRHAE